jgi:hypothetical protein
VAFVTIGLLPGILMIAFPGPIHRFYVSFHGEAHTRREHQPRHIRNAGVFWILIVGLMMYFLPEPWRRAAT